MNILETKNLSFAYKKQNILDAIDLQIPKGSIYGYLGKNGAGKTTTIKLLLDLLDTPSNTVYYEEKEFKSHREEILQNIGSLIESPCYYDNLSGFQNLEYLDIIFKCEKKRIKEVLEMTGLTSAENKKVSKYSTGMKQRLGIAMAILHNPSLLILDEPLNGLDPEGVHEIRELMIQLKNEGKTILLSSHILSEIEKTCTHVGILNKGKLLYQGGLRDLVANIGKELLIKTNDATKGLNICHQNLISARNISSNELLVTIDNEQLHNKLIQLLVANQIDIYSIESKENSLESIFLNLIAN